MLLNLPKMRRAERKKKWEESTSRTKNSWCFGNNFFLSLWAHLCVCVGFLNSEIVVNKLAVKQSQVFFLHPLNYFRYQAEKSVEPSVTAQCFILWFFLKAERETTQIISFTSELNSLGISWVLLEIQQEAW